MRICLISHPFTKKYKGEREVLIKNVEILKKIAKIRIITDFTSEKFTNCDIELINLPISNNFFVYIPLYIISEIFIIIRLFTSIRKDEIYIIFGWSPLLVTLFLRFFKRKVVVLRHANIIESILILYGKTLTRVQRKFLYSIANLIEQLNYLMANSIFIDYKELVHQLPLPKYGYKVHLLNTQYIDSNLFKIVRPLNKRGNLVGYIGRLSPEKGVLNLVNAIPLVVKKREDIGFIIIGEGVLQNKIKTLIKKYNISNRVKIYDWKPYRIIPKYLNEIKLLVVPSYVEGLPNIILEAMACGTPVIANDIGAASQVITNEVTGFLIKNNKPATIADKIIYALSHPQLNIISKRAHEIVKSKFGKAAVISRYSYYLNKLFKK